MKKKNTLLGFLRSEEVRPTLIVILIGLAIAIVGSFVAKYSRVIGMMMLVAGTFMSLGNAARLSEKMPKDR